LAKECYRFVREITFWYCPQCLLGAYSDVAIMTQSASLCLLCRITVIFQSLDGRNTIWPRNITVLYEITFWYCPQCLLGVYSDVATMPQSSSLCLSSKITIIFQSLDGRNTIWPRNVTVLYRKSRSGTAYNACQGHIPTSLS
jgi:hypothetical protein